MPLLPRPAGRFFAELLFTNLTSVTSFNPDQNSSSKPPSASASCCAIAKMASVRRAPYRDFLQPALQRRFSTTAAILLGISFVEAVIFADWQSRKLHPADVVVGVLGGLTDVEAVW